jgi:hypothetical protein
MFLARAEGCEHLWLQRIEKARAIIGYDHYKMCIPLRECHFDNTALLALDGIEAKLGRAMLASGDKEGEPLFKAAVAEIKKQHGFDKMGAKEELAAGDLETVGLCAGR